MAGAHQRGCPLDAEYLVVARDGVDRNGEARQLLSEEIVVAARDHLGHPQRVPHQVPGEEDEGRSDGVGHGAQPPEPWQAGAVQVKV